ncbi:MAG: HD-GYP domain-containing protein, partial [Gemmatimonadaceae bacterium]
RGLRGDQIPLAARLFAVVDVWDALRSDRPYRKGWSDEKVRQHIREGSGTHFDPRAIELFFHSLDELSSVESLTDNLEDVPLAL